MIQEKTGRQTPLDPLPLKEGALYNQSGLNFAKKFRQKIFLHFFSYECLCQVCFTFGKKNYSCPFCNKAPVTLEKVEVPKGRGVIFL
jgi:hypothetical protein